jgi:hypothetical protein
MPGNKARRRARGFLPRTNSIILVSHAQKSEIRSQNSERNLDREAIGRRSDFCFLTSDF